MRYDQRSSMTGIPSEEVAHYHTHTHRIDEQWSWIDADTDAKTVPYKCALARMDRCHCSFRFFLSQFKRIAWIVWFSTSRKIISCVSLNCCWMKCVCFLQECLTYFCMPLNWAETLKMSRENTAYKSRYLQYAQVLCGMRRPTMAPSNFIPSQRILDFIDLLS